MATTDEATGVRFIDNQSDDTKAQTDDSNENENKKKAEQPKQINDKKTANDSSISSTCPRPSSSLQFLTAPPSANKRPPFMLFREGCITCGPSCRSTFHVEGICCALEVPIVTSIIESVPSKRQSIYQVRINITNRKVYVTHNPEEVTADDILLELSQQGFEKSHIEEDGSILYEKRKIKKEKEINTKQQQQNEKEIVTFNEELNDQQHQQQQSIPPNEANEENNNMIDIEMNNTKTSSVTFVESVIYTKSLSEDAIEAMSEIFCNNGFLYNCIRSYSPNIASKTIKIEHNPELVSIQQVFDAIKMNNESDGQTYFDDCKILVDGFQERLFLPSNPTCDNQHSGDYDRLIDDEGEEVTSSSSAFRSLFTQMRQKITCWFHSCNTEPHNGLSINIILSGVFWVVSVVGDIIDNQILLYFGLFAVLFGLPPVIRKAFHTLRRKQFDANCMMAIAALGSVALQEFDEAASVSFLFSISEYLEEKATRKAKKAMDDIINLRPEHANYIDKVTREIKIIPVNDLGIDDFVSVRVGDKVPSDGVIVEGFSQIDESSLTGESVPVSKDVGDTVSGGTINIGSTRLIVRISALVEDSAVSRLIRLVEESASSRSPTEQLVDAFARSYTPTVIFVALILCTIPWFWGLDIGREWTLNGLIIIVIACPCALTISTPVTYAAGLAATAKKGIIVKGGAKLEALGNVKRIVFDKTGTLTEGKFQLVDLKLIGNKKSRREVLTLLAVMEGPSSHPLAAALVTAAKDEGVKISSSAVAIDHLTLKGEGVTAKVNDVETYVGNVRLFKRLGMFDKLLDSEKKIAIEWNDQGSTVGFLGIEGFGIVAMFCVADVVRDEAKDIVQALTRYGIDIFMLTGDGAGPAKTVASKVGIPQENIQSQFLPEDKLHHVASMLRSSKQGSLCAKKELLLMCGDGVNDAPALAVADVGVAMGNGAAVALEISDVTLMDSNLSKLLFSIKIGRKVIATVKENIAVSVAAKIIVIILTFRGQMTLLAAIASDVGIMLLVSINGMKLLPGETGLCCKRKRPKYGRIELQNQTTSIV